MFYVLNFKDHSFFTANDTSEADAYILTLLNNHQAEEDDIEVVSCFDGESRMTVSEFRAMAGEQEV